MELRKKARRDWLLLCGLQSCYWITMTLHSSFLVFYLNQCGYETTVIASMTMAMTFVNLVTQPLWGYVADALIGMKRAILCCLLGSLLPLLLLPALVKYVWLTLLLNLFYGAVNYPLQGLTDSITNIAAEKNSFVVYGFTRGCGSISSAVGSLLIGYVLDYTDTKYLFLIEAAILGLASVLMGLYKDTAYGPEAETKTVGGRKATRSAVLELLRKPAYLGILFCITLMNVGNRTTLFFVPILIEEYGGDNVHLGWCLFLNCLFMMPCMMLHSRMLKRGIKNHVPLLLGASFHVVRAFLMYFARTLPVLVGLQLMQSFAYGFLQPSTVAAAGEASPLSVRATAISLAVAITTVFSTVIGQIGGSYLAGYIGVHNTFLVSAAITFLGILSYLPFTRHAKKAPARP
jgi:PPP family 3-phenylpropionic acid transporter